MDNPPAQCPCLECSNDRQDGCSAPNKCIIEAREILASLGPKWWTASEQPDDLDLSEAQKVRNAQARDENEKILFNPSVKSRGPPAHHMRIFTVKEGPESGLPAKRSPRLVNLPSITAYVAGMKILRRKPAVDRKKTKSHLKLCREAIKANQGSSPSEEAIWESLSDKDLSNKQDTFLWKSLHDAFKTRGFWKHIPNFEGRGICPECGTEEDLEHILLKCKIPGQKIIWQLAKSLVEKRGIQWPDLSLGLIMSIGLVEPTMIEPSQSPVIKGSSK
ncbi:hypothetical protein FISHEDRAFT_32392 [Fistulina hepatica ATCC 64428]|uniref:Reverse transcriptase zinc-binding domain-containing protein n=1 Tax=Fistulina hepatica ATCC 64428 TaxID=1128425 RepID=A0A0D7APX5_9AGAR|nr:hypothetical protein FISHEDRAFT_32392 [Fistulina hepatica ATCC 64428]